MMQRSIQNCKKQIANGKETPNCKTQVSLVQDFKHPPIQPLCALHQPGSRPVKQRIVDHAHVSALHRSQAIPTRTLQEQIAIPERSRPTPTDDNQIRIVLGDFFQCDRTTKLPCWHRELRSASDLGQFRHPIARRERHPRDRGNVFGHTRSRSLRAPRRLHTIGRPHGT